MLGRSGDQVELELDWPDGDAWPCFPSLGAPGLRVFVDIDRLADGGEAHAPTAGVYARSPKNPSLAAVGNGCLIVVGEHPAGGFFSHGDRYSSGAPRWVVEAGASLTWPDGEPAGVAYHEILVREPPSDDEALRCFVPNGPRGWPLDGLRLCAEPAAVHESGTGWIW